MKTLLFIDDEHAGRTPLVEFLTHHGWHVWEAANGESGLSLAKLHRPAVVLCDLLMPGTNGYQVCAALRADPVLRHTRIIAISGKDFPTNRADALAAGADEFVVKPFSPSELVKLLDGLSQTPAARQAPATAPSTPRPACLKFWGVRGSIPTPGPATVHFGGNTSCIEVRADGEIIILDSGTGIRPLGLQLVGEFKDQPLSVTILITHTHWDHIQGFPFFLPAYDPRNHIRILGYEGSRARLAGVFSSQMESPYFPIGLKELPGNIVIEELRDMQFTVGKVGVRAEFMNHPGICVGYRLKTSDGVIVYLPDNEPFYRGHAEARTPHAATDTTAFIHAEEAKMVEFIRGADVLIGDAQYDAEEYQAHLGWGHGSVDDLVTLALRGQVKRLYLFHHDPEHDDAKVARMVEHARKLVAAQDGRLVVEGAREGEQFELTGPRG